MTQATTNSNVAAATTVPVRLTKVEKAKAAALAKRRHEAMLAKAAAKAEASVNTSLAKLTLTTAIPLFIEAHGKAQGLARVMWHKIADETGMKDWHTLTVRNARGNEKAVFERIEEIRKDVQAAQKAKNPNGNVNKPWSDIRAIGRDANKDSTTRAGKALEVRFRDDLTKLYKAGMKEERPTEFELEVNALIGNILQMKYKVSHADLG